MLIEELEKTTLTKAEDHMRLRYLKNIAFDLIAKEVRSVPHCSRS